jgi:hypothetical protein
MGRTAHFGPKQSTGTSAATPTARLGFANTRHARLRILDPSQLFTDMRESRRLPQGLTANWPDLYIQSRTHLRFVFTFERLSRVYRCFEMFILSAADSRLYPARQDVQSNFDCLFGFIL